MNRIVLLTFHSKLYEGVFRASELNHLAYCRKHGYTYMPIYLTDPEVPTCVGFEILRSLLEIYDIVLLMGVDTLFMNSEKSIEEMFALDTAQQIANQPDQPTYYNNDVMLWRAGLSSQRLIDNVFDSEVLWRQRQFSWQDHLADLINSKSELTSLLRTVNFHQMNAQWEFYEEGDWIIHFYFQSPPASGNDVVTEKEVLIKQFIGQAK